MPRTLSRRVAAVAISAVLLASAVLAQNAPPTAPATPAVTPAPAAAAPTRGPVNQDALYNASMQERSALLGKVRPVTDEMLRNPPEGDWLTWRRNYESTGFSPLKQINKRNVATLENAWSWSLAVSNNSITPLVHDGLIFVDSGNRVQALDGRTGDLLWQYLRPLPPALNNGATSTRRNIAIYGDKLIVPTADTHVVALNVKTGQVVWDHAVGTPEDRLRLTGGPMVAKGKVIQGVSGCSGANYAGGCFILALDADTGAEAWRFNSIPRPGEPGGNTWNGAPMDDRFGGSVWTSGSYDPELDLLYFGIGQTYYTAPLLQPQAEKGESADGLYTASTVALNPDTGKLVWHYQHFAREVWDFDWVFERTLATLPVNGVQRRVSITAGKLAIFDVIDRTNGQYLYSRDVGVQNLVASIDPKTGAKNVAPQFTPEANVTKLICPHAGGARSWPATTYNPATKIVYIPIVESCMDFTWRPRDPNSTDPRAGDIRWVLKPRPDSDGKFGRVEAINLETGKTVWSQRRRAPQASSILGTAGGLIFEGGRDRMFRASDDMTGKLLWETRLNAVPSSSPVTYSVDGQQYVAVVTGGGNPHEATWPTLTPEIDNPAGATTLWVFALPKR